MTSRCNNESCEGGEPGEKKQSSLSNTTVNTAGAASGAHGKACVVTGAGSGFGREIALLFAQRGGCGVVCFDINAEAADAVAKDINMGCSERDGSFGCPPQRCRAVSLGGDVSNEEDVKRAVQLCVREFGQINVMFANAGVVDLVQNMLDEDRDMWERAFRINTLGVFFSIKHAALAMRAQKPGPHDAGSIVCVASVAGLRAGAGPAAYSASKAAVINLAQTSAAKLGFAGPGNNIRVNAICPGLVETGMTGALFEMARQRGTTSKIGQLTPAQQPGSARGVAEVAVFLASDAAGMVTGQVLPVDCGLSACLPFVPGSKL